LGIAAMFLASKYEEIYPPKFNLFLEVNAGVYQKQDILRMEAQIIKMLNFKFTIVSTFAFIEYYHSILKLDNKSLWLC